MHSLQIFTEYVFYQIMYRCCWEHSGEQNRPSSSLKEFGGEWVIKGRPWDIMVSAMDTSNLPGERQMSQGGPRGWILWLQLQAERECRRKEGLAAMGAGVGSMASLKMWDSTGIKRKGWVCERRGCPPSKGVWGKEEWWNGNSSSSTGLFWAKVIQQRTCPCQAPGSAVDMKMTDLTPTMEGFPSSKTKVDPCWSITLQRVKCSIRELEKIQREFRRRHVGFLQQYL